MTRANIYQFAQLFSGEIYDEVTNDYQLEERIMDKYSRQE
jgi:hypothetical protein